MSSNRRRLLEACAFLAVLGGGRMWSDAMAAEPAAEHDAATLLRRGEPGLVVVMRHALAPGTFDPPGYRLDDCSTQRNLNDAGREQAGRVGRWFRQQSLVPDRVRSSAWCRCLETARLAFGHAEPWAPLDSFIGERARQAEHIAALRAELARLAARGASEGFEVWVTHQVNIQALAGASTAAGEAVLLRHDATRDAVVALTSLHVE